MIILVGPSATGKTQIGFALKRLFGINKVVTYTTRDTRDGEISGIDYHFISKDEFLKKNKDGFFFEMVEYNNNYYGTSVSSLNNDSYLILEPNGMKKYLSSSLNIKVFYLDCSEEVRLDRMIRRKDGLENALKRIEIDKTIFTDEIKLLSNYVIDVSSKTVDEIATIIYKLCH